MRRTRSHLAALIISCFLLLPATLLHGQTQTPPQGNADKVERIFLIEPERGIIHGEDSGYCVYGPPHPENREAFNRDFGKALAGELSVLRKYGCYPTRQQAEDAMARLPQPPAAPPKPALFRVFGKIVDREPSSILVWGRAVPYGNESQFGSLTYEANIMVENPNPSGILGGQYYRADHCFLRKASGTNAFGAAVPVWVYGTCNAGR